MHIALGITNITKGVITSIATVRAIEIAWTVSHTGRIAIYALSLASVVSAVLRAISVDETTLV